MARTFLIDPNVLANLTSTLGYSIYVNICLFLLLCPLLLNRVKKKNTKLITGNGRPDATLSASGVDARGEANSEELFLPKLNEKGDLGNTPGLVDDVVVVLVLVVYFK